MRSSISCVFALMLFVGSASNAAAPPSAGVQVVNTAANPVPVTGSVTSQVTGTVNVSGSVNVTNSSLPVNVQNSSLPVNVQNFVHSLAPSISAASYSS